MYRMIEGKGLKPYYYKLINTELFSFRDKSDRYYKKVVYYGHGSYLVGFKTQFKTSKTSNYIYCLEAVSSTQKTQYFVTSLYEFDQWKKVFLQVMGLPGLFIDDFELLKDTGEGHFGKVFKTANLKNRETVAIKAINKAKLKSITARLLRQQIQIHMLCNHPNIVTLHNVYEDEDNVYLEMEYVPGQNLTKYIRNGDPISHWFILGILYQVAKALQFLRDLNIMHRDIKLHNILLTGKFIKFKDQVTDAQFEIPQIKLADFGLATVIQSNEMPSLLAGTYAYMAPEVVLSLTYDYSADIYSLGVVAYYLISKQLPFTSSDIKTLKKKLIHEKPDFSLESFETIPRFLRSLIQKMLSKLSQQRPSLEQIIKLGFKYFAECGLKSSKSDTTP